jgi:hypothetical protein
MVVYRLKLAPRQSNLPLAGGIRTGHPSRVHNRLIRAQMLYQLRYESVIKL